MYSVSHASLKSGDSIHRSEGAGEAASVRSVPLTPSKLQELDVICQDISARTKLSTTGYQTSMSRLVNNHKPDEKSLMTLERAQEYSTTAKMQFPSSRTLAELAKIQKDFINNTQDGELVSPIHMDESQLTQCLEKCRSSGFSNYDIQVLEVAMHLRHKLGVTEFEMVSNSKLSHNYITVNPSEYFPKGGIIDTWTGIGIGLGFTELSLTNQVRYKHVDANLSKNQTMHDWVEKHGANYLMN